MTTNHPWTSRELAMMSDKPPFRPCDACPLVAAKENEIDRAALEDRENEPDEPLEVTR